MSDGSMHSLDALIITYNRPAYTRKSLTRLLDTCDDGARIWIWHNGTDEETLAVSRSASTHPRVARFYHSVENVRLRDPTNWLWSNGRAEFVAKIDDDCLMPVGWANALCAAHAENPVFGAIAGWRFLPQDFDPSLSGPKITEFAGGYKLLQNFWVPGGGYVMKRRCIDEHGLLRRGETFTQYCIRLALSGYVNGWLYPFLYVDHMDDPRSPNTELRTDDDLHQHPPLSLALTGARTLAEWEAQMRLSARRVQAASIDPRDYRGWRPQLQRVRRAVRRLRRRSDPARLEAFARR